MSDPADADRFVQRLHRARGHRRPSSTFRSRSGRACSGCSPPATRSPATTAPDALARLEALAPPAAGAIANALDFHRERRVAAALTRGFIPPRRRRHPGLRARPRLRARGPRRRRGRHLRRVDAAERRAGGARGRRHRQGPRGRRAERDGALLRRGAHAGTPSAPVRSWPRPTALLGGRLPSASFVTAFMGVIADGTLRWANAGHAPPVAPAPRGRGGAQGHRRAPRRRGRRALRRARDAVRPRRRAVRLDRRAHRGPPRRSRSSASGACPTVLAEHGRTLAPRRARRRSSTARSRRGRRSSTTTSSCSPCARARDPPREPRPARPSRALFAAVHGPRARAAGRRLRAHRGDLRHRGRLRRRRAPRGWSLLRRRRGRGVRRPAPARARRRPRSSGCSSTAPARRRGHARALLAELERLAAADGCASACACYTTEVLREARALYTRLRLSPGGRRRDRRAHRPVAGEGDHARLTHAPQRPRRRPVGSPCGHARHQSSDRAAGGWRSSPAPAAGWARRSCSGWPPTASRSRRATSGPRRDRRCTASSTSSIAARSAPSSRASRPSSARRAWSSPPPASSAPDASETRRGGGLEARHRRQPHGHLERDPGGAAGDARAAQRAHRHALLGDRPRRPRALRGLRGIQGRRDRADQGTGARAGSAGHLRQQRRARTDRGRHAAARGGLQRRLAGRSRAARALGSARARSPRPWPCWRATTAATTWVRSSRPTAGPSSERWTARPTPSSASSAAGFDHIPEGERTMTLRETAYFWVGMNANLFFVAVGVIAIELGPAACGRRSSPSCSARCCSRPSPLASIAGVRAGPADDDLHARRVRPARQPAARRAGLGGIGRLRGDQLHLRRLRRCSR